MIRLLCIWIARFRYESIAAELAAVERQLVQQIAYRDYLLDAERKANIAVAVAEGRQDAVAPEPLERVAIRTRKVARG